ncbi:branched-chain amino acid ABC transporter permease [Rhodoluna sp.]|uniref:branched-chain amino acid ABC transporter permease n=1 Tax=Rhodoluna sp. TaxID=1969481 RepID=UPI0026000348|nr:branched-chain amino acid ABC transporter permease [Rhodoluna sp.]
MTSQLSADYKVDHFQKKATVVGLVGAAVFLFAAVAPYIFATDVTSAWIKLFYLISLATTWNLLAGYAGMVSVGQQAYIGLGAYGIFVFNDMGLDPYSSVLVASVAVGIIAFPISYVAFRLRGGYFAIGTWVIAEATRQIVIRFDSLGSGRGRSITTYTEDAIYRNLFTYWVALAIMGLAIVATFYLLRSRLGVALQSIRDNEVAAKSMGIKVSQTKRIVFVVAAMGAAAAGGIICLQGLGVASPNTIFGVNYSAFMIFMVLIGGIGTIEGPIIGAIIYFLMDYYFSQMGLWYMVVLGVLAILIMLFLPRGVWGEISHRFNFKVFPVGHQVQPLFPGIKLKKK